MKIKKIAAIIFLIILIKITLLLALKDTGAKIIIEKTLERFLGLDVSIKKAKLEISPKTTSIYIADLKVYNPSSCPETEMIDFPSIVLKIKNKSILAGKPHFESLSIYMRNLNIIKTNSGELNISKLGPLKKKLFSENLSSEESENKTESEKNRLDLYPIEKVDVKIDKITFKDYGVFPVLVKEIEINLNASYDDIKDLTLVCDVIFYKIFSVNEYLLKILDINLNLLKNAISKIINTAGNVISSGTDALKKILPEQVFKNQDSNIANISEGAK